MEAVLFYVEDDTSLPHDRTRIDQWCAIAGITHLMVDLSATMSKVNGNVFYTIQEALDAFPEDQFVFIIETGARLLTDYVHPAKDIIYCFGSDTDGFQGLNLSSYTTLKVQYANGTDNEWYASTLVPLVVAHRMYT